MGLSSGESGHDQYHLWPRLGFGRSLLRGTAPKISNRVWIPRIEIKTARRIRLRRAVFRLSPKDSTKPAIPFLRLKAARNVEASPNEFAATSWQMKSYKVQSQPPL